MSLAQSRGYLILQLHAHLPFVRHPEHEFFLEEQWFYEAVIETYIPALMNMEAWEREGLHWRLSMSLTPPLLSMMKDPLLQKRFDSHLRKLEELLEKELERTKDRPEFLRSAKHYQAELKKSRAVWEAYGHDLTTGFKKFIATGKLEAITCGATHGFLPYLAEVPGSVRAQVEIACRYHEEVLGARPKGIWLPECAYLADNDRFLKEAGIEFCYLDTHGLLHADPKPRYGVYGPLVTRAGIATFGRDIESSRQVWSREVGYPGDPDYREFYRDIGFDCDWEYIKEYVHEDLGIRLNTGIKYHRVTGPKVDLGEKDIYDPEKAAGKARQHAWNFIYNRQNQVNWLGQRMDRPACIVSPYDAELFGHWWYEGPQFIDHAMRAMNANLGLLAPTHPREFLEAFPQNQVSDFSFSTWGAEGYGSVWLNSTNEWIYRHLHGAARRMNKLAGEHKAAGGWRARVLNQMGRELLLAQASDWAFILNARTATEYAIKRTRVHLHRLCKMADWIEAGSPDMALLAEYEAKDNIFPHAMDFTLFA